MSEPVSQIVPYTCTVLLGTPASNPQVFPMQLPVNLDVRWVEWEVPPGPRGDVGFWIGSHGQPIIPYAIGAPNWIVTDNRVAHWDLFNLPDSGDWELRAYNTGVKSHTISVFWGLAVPSLTAPAGPTLLTPETLSSPLPGA